MQLVHAVLAVAALARWAVAMSASESTEDFGDVMLGYEKNRDECIRQLGVKEDDFKGSSDPHWKITHCLMEKDGTIGADGRFSADGVLAHIGKLLKAQPNRLAFAKTVIEMCRSELESDTAMKEELARKIMTCFKTHEIQLTNQSSTTTVPPM